MINGRPKLAILLILISITLFPLNAEAFCSESNINKAIRLDNEARKTVLSADKSTDLRRKAKLLDQAVFMFWEARKYYDRIARQCRGEDASWARKNRSTADKFIASIKRSADLMQKKEKKDKAIQKALQSNFGSMIKEEAQKIKAECEKSPTCPHYNKGRQLLNDKRYREAIKEFDEVIGLDATYEAAYVMKGIALTRLGKSKEAISQFDRGIAVAVAKQASKMWFWWPHYHKGIALFSLRQVKAARTDFSASIALNPTANAYLGRAKTYAAEQNAKRALADIDQAIKLDPENAKLWSFKANVHFASRSNKLGCAALKQACDLGECRSSPCALISGSKP